MARQPADIGLRPKRHGLFVQIKRACSTDGVRDDKPLKHMNAVIRRADGGVLPQTVVPTLRPGESAENAFTLNAKRRQEECFDTYQLVCFGFIDNASDEWH